jgi:hypothetical protein
MEENLAGIRPERAALLKRALGQWVAQVSAGAMQGGDGIEADPILEERLKSLGYVQ